jgi:hypothetical protein
MLLTPRKAGRGYTAAFTMGLDLFDATTGDDDSPRLGGGRPTEPPPG